MNMHRLPIDNSTANYGATIEGTGFASRPVGCEAIGCRDPITVLFDAYDRNIGRSTNTSSILSNCIQNGLNVRRRAGDNTQDLARRRLLLQRLLEFLEQPHIFDRDHRLVGEGFQQLDLRRGERAHLNATCTNVPISSPLLTKGNESKSAPACWQNPSLGNRSARGRRERGACHARVSSDPWLINTDLDAANRYGTKMSPRNHQVPLVESQHHVIDPTNPGGALDDGIEHRLHVGGRAADDAEHFGRRRLMLQGLAQFRIALAAVP